MKRDMELVRTILLKAEEIEPGEELVQEVLGPRLDEGVPKAEVLIIFNHIVLLEEAGFLKGSPSLGGNYLLEGITWQGYEFLDAVRDPEIWRKTKAGVVKVGGASVQVMWELAKGFGKQALKDKLGIDL